ncbi:hypothetical protein [Lysinibacillus sp. NPDC056185]|uniref:hypothetical protein n=1 Tax=Lysinibacillus sp. NPDC056185 TaxID=3345739 RepID=UPI0039EE3E35
MSEVIYRATGALQVAPRSQIDKLVSEGQKRVRRAFGALQSVEVEGVFSDILMMLNEESKLPVTRTPKES